MHSHTDTYYYVPMYSYEGSPVTDNVETVFSEIKIREERPNQNLVHLGVYIKDEVLGKVTAKITGEKYYPYFIGVKPVLSFVNYFSNSELIDNVIKNNNVYLTIKNEQSSSFSLKVTILGTGYSQVITGAEETISIPMSDIYGRLGVVHIGKN